MTMRGIWPGKQCAVCGVVVMLAGVLGCGGPPEAPVPEASEEIGTGDDAPRGLSVATAEAAEGYVLFNPAR